MSAKKKVSIRELMPRGYTVLLVKETNRPQSYITKVVLNEVTTSPIWPNVLRLAEATKKQRLEEAAQLDALKSVA